MRRRGGAAPVSCGSRGWCPALPWQRRRRLRLPLPLRIPIPSAPLPVPLPALPTRRPDSSAVRHGPPPPLPGPHPARKGLIPSAARALGQRAASPQACLGGDGLVLPRWEHLLPAGLREEGGSPCPGCWGELVLSCLNRDCPARGSVGGTRLVLPGREESRAGMVAVGCAPHPA